MDWSALQLRAYVPYSDKPRACVVQSTKGSFFPGVRVENISFPITIGAIQSALFICLSEGEIPAKLFLPDTGFDQLDYWKTEFDTQVMITDTLPSKHFKEISLPGDQDDRSVLKDLLDLAVTIHSDFPVSCILKTTTGSFTGVNIEVSDWALGLCAERVAVAKALAYGADSFDSLSIHTRDGEFSSPCGSCRQVIVEHMPLKKVRLHHADASISEHLSSDLLPFNFASKILKK